MATTFDVLEQETWYPYNEKRDTARVTPVFAENSNELIIKEKAECVGVAFDGILKAIPSNLSEFAPMMHSLDVVDCGFKKITRDDLKGLEMLKNLHVSLMDIEELPGDLFADLLNLEFIDFRSNKIRLIGKGIFKDLEKLKFVDLSDNCSAEDIVYCTTDDVKFPKEVIRVWYLDQFSVLLEAFFPPFALAPLHDIQKVLQTDECKDFTIKVGEEEMKAHKLLLIARSPTFADTIKNNPKADELILEDIEPGVFRVILNYIYNNVTPTEFDETTEKIFAAAGKLKLDELKEKVGEILCDSVTPENSMKFLTLASNCHHQYLKEKAFDELKIFLADNSLPDEFMANVEILNEMYQAKKAYDMMRKSKRQSKNLRIKASESQD